MVDVLVPAVEKAFKNPEVVKRAVNLGMVHEFMGPAELRKNLESDIKIIKEVSAEAGLVK